MPRILTYHIFLKLPPVKVALTQRCDPYIGLCPWASPSPSLALVISEVDNSLMFYDEKELLCKKGWKKWNSYHLFFFLDLWCRGFNFRGILSLLVWAGFFLSLISSLNNLLSSLPCSASVWDFPQRQPLFPFKTSPKGNHYNVFNVYLHVSCKMYIVLYICIF